MRRWARLTAAQVSKDQQKISPYRESVLAMIRKVGSRIKGPDQRGGELFARSPRSSEIVDESGAEGEDRSEICDCDGIPTISSGLSRLLENEDIAVIEELGNSDLLRSCAREMLAERLEEGILRFADDTHGDHLLAPISN